MKKYNLIFLYTDEQRYDTLAVYGNHLIEMPNLNRFAESAAVFDQAYVTQPVCTPSRSSLLTGQWPHTNGLTANNVPLKTETRCLPEMISPEYKTAHFGKWHLGDEIWAQHGFREWRAIEDQYSSHYSEGRDRNELSHYSKWLRDKHGMVPGGGMSYFSREAVTRLPEKCSKPAYLAEEACRFLDENKNGPFILYVNFLEPHMPFSGPRDDQYDPENIPLPENYEAVPDSTHHPRTRANWEKWKKSIPTERKLRELIARYWGLCSQVDTHAGRILDKLRELGLEDNTIVVYTSDHGDMMGSHQLVAKTVQYQEAVRVPLLIRLPGQKEGFRINGPVSQIDIVPTLLELMGEKVPEDCQGKSLRDILVDRKENLEQDIFVEWNGDNGASEDIRLDGNSAPGRDTLKKAINDRIRTVITADGWRFSCSPMGFHELFKLTEDPGEKHNLAQDEKYRPLMRELRKKIISWQRETGDNADLPEI